MAFFPIKLIPENTKIDFIKKRGLAFLISIILIFSSLGLAFTKGLNLGIDFTGGIVIESRFKEEVDISLVREQLLKKNIGDVSLQYLGSKNEIMIRIGVPNSGSDSLPQATAMAKDELHKLFGNDIDYRKVDYVGPKVGSELVIGGSLALILSFIAILIYIWARFEWQFGVGAIAALIHDVIIAIGFFSATQLEFNLSSIAALLTIIGYSINDSVVIYDRVRENLRRYKKKPLNELLNLSINDTLSRTINTTGTTLLALLALVIFGGSVIKSFSLAMLFGIIIGTYSSVYIASPVLMFTKLKRNS